MPSWPIYNRSLHRTPCQLTSDCSVHRIWPGHSSIARRFCLIISKPCFSPGLSLMSTIRVRTAKQSRPKSAGKLLRLPPESVRDNPIVVPASAHALGGFQKWAQSDQFPQRGQISFLKEGIYIDMSPEELETHAKVKAEI